MKYKFLQTSAITLGLALSVMAFDSLCPKNTFAGPGTITFDKEVSGRIHSPSRTSLTIEVMTVTEHQRMSIPINSEVLEQIKPNMNMKITWPEKVTVLEGHNHPLRISWKDWVETGGYVELYTVMGDIRSALRLPGKELPAPLNSSLRAYACLTCMDWMVSREKDGRVGSDSIYAYRSGIYEGSELKAKFSDTIDQKFLEEIAKPLRY